MQTQHVLLARAAGRALLDRKSEKANTCVYVDVNIAVFFELPE